MSKKSYRDILTRYIQEHKVEDASKKMDMLSDWLRVYIARR